MDYHKLYDAVNGIKENVGLEEKICANLSGKTRKKTAGNRMRKLATVCILITVFSVTIGILRKTDEKGDVVAPFSICVYAMDEDGQLRGNIIQMDRDTPVSLVKATNGKKGFLFAYENLGADPKSFLGPAGEKNTISVALDCIVPEEGKQYSIFFPKEEDSPPYEYKMTIPQKDISPAIAQVNGLDEQAYYTATIRITANNGIYQAKLISISQASPMGEDNDKRG